ncbi:VWA domain-containing protein [Flagellimonas sp. CMM7]|uniref:VWA domain-containing protein n=1 Tax=Flagellimonas sp. CMM7 TaxID=2654676 RepID=UPI0013D5F15D|nr:VWA domain-containing protein [Flagellimonas sp. CMM7]UII79669.1 VWA domain-containing protein [Flagellimonas sp. CMM7]
MEIRTVLLIILAAIVALATVFFQYLYKNPRKGNLKITLAGLRFLSLFCALLLLINPKFTRHDYFLEKANLIVLVDDSSSMKDASEENSVESQVQKVLENEDLKERFSIQQYTFGTAIQQTDSLRLDKKNTDISNALSTVDEIFVNGTNSVLLFTDGNQTLGKDYEYINLAADLSVNPVVIGDTTSYEDVSIGRLNVNTYAFLKNKFPVEATILYKGSRSVSRTVTISLDGKSVYRENVELSKNRSSQTINTLLVAESVGVKSIKIDVQPLENEKNIANNSKESAIEVIDEKTNVAIISDILHPDIGAIKKSIEANEQRSVTILKPTVSVDRFKDTDIFILYQPDRRFRSVYEYLSKVRANTFTITGTKTDWGFLNQVQQSFFKENFNQNEEIIPVLNNAFSIFGLGDFNVVDFPPLQNNLGDIDLKKNGETILFQQIRGVDLDKPLFTIIAENLQKEAVLFGENIWKWRAQVYRNSKSFKEFDDFIGKLMVYLASDNQKSRLELDFDLVFEDSSIAKVRASYFDESYNFDSNSNISIKIDGKQNDFSREAPMLLKGSFFEIDLSDLDAGEYDFTVTVEGENQKRSGAFKILDFDPEKQSISSNYGKLEKLADKTNGDIYFPTDIDLLIKNLSSAEQYVPIQKSKQNVVSLIDFRVLLGIIVLTLSLEWFIRKFNGLI